MWAMKLLTRARESGKIKIEPPVFANLQSTFLDIEEAHRKLLSYGWVNFPLAYTQVACFNYFLMSTTLSNKNVQNIVKTPKYDKSFSY